jgi:CO dehydrogenase/acetyl-CoA synthase delta subunit
VTGAKRLGLPRPARVSAAAADGRPLRVDGSAVDAIRESWLIEDRWWAQRGLRRRYWEVVTADGRDLVVFHDLDAGGWFRQR